jgi:NAD(P)-dependent dehydrogenase (short-subunit alcohol dehydrogenase family)
MPLIDKPHCYQAPDKLLDERIIVVTGAGDGIGRAAAKAYAAAGATVILLGKTIEKLESVYDEIEQAGHPLPAIYPIHFGGAVMKDYGDLAVTLENEFGHIDGLLNNASILGDLKPIAQYNDENWLEVMQINVNAPFMLTQALLPLLMKSKDASIIFTSSGVGRKGRAFWGAYAVSKFATEGMMEVLADELSETSPVRVNAINPGATNTRMRQSAFPGENPQSNPNPEQIMPLYLYLMGPDSQGVSGLSLDAQPKT